MTQSNGNVGEVVKRPVEIVRDKLNSHVELIRQVLPTDLKEEADRLVKRALIYFARKDKLMECTPMSFVQCVIDAAEIGLPLDGRLGHAVPYSVKVSKKGEKDRWEMQAQFQPDYKGLVSVARRSGQVVGAKADIVCENDTFRHGRSGPISVLEHTYPLDKPRGKTIGGYAIVRYGDAPDDWEYDIMSFADLEKIRNRSKAKDSGPWVDFPDEMRKKTVMKRALKTYCDDPSLLRAIELDEREFDCEAISTTESRRKVKHSPLNETLVLPAPSTPFEIPSTEDTREYDYVDAPSRHVDEPAQQHHANNSGPQVAAVFDFAAFNADLAKAKSHADVEALSYATLIDSKYGLANEKDEAFVRKSCEARKQDIQPRGDKAKQATMV